MPLTYSPDGSLLLTATPRSPGLALWEVEDERERCRFDTRAGGAVSFSPDGRHFLACGEHTVEVWSLEGACRVLRLECGGVPGGVQAAAFSADSAFVLAGGRLLETATGREVRRYDDALSFRVAAFSPDGATALVGWDGGEVWLLSVTTGERLQRYEIEPSAERPAAFDPRGGYVVTASPRGPRVWSSASGEPVAEDLNGFTTTSVAFSPDGDHVLVGTGYGYRDNVRGQDREYARAYVWHWPSGDVASLVDAFDAPRAAFSPDGRWLLAPVWTTAAYVLTDGQWARDIYWIPARAAVLHAFPDCSSALQTWAAPVVQHERQTHEDLDREWDVSCLAWHPDGSQFAFEASYFRPSFVGVIDLHSRAQLHTLRPARETAARSEEASVEGLAPLCNSRKRSGDSRQTEPEPTSG